MQKDKILIVGATGTVGKACCLKFEQVGYDVITTTSQKSLANNQTVWWLDFNSQNSIDEFNLRGPIKHIIIAAGMEPQKNLEESSPAHLLQMLNIHLIGPILILKKMKPHLQSGGSIMLLSSPAALKGSYDPIYASAKGAVNTLVKTLAKDFAPHIRINAISPSLIIDSPVYKRMTPDFRLKHLNNTLTQKHTTAEECANAIHFICHSEQITGQVLQVNGGMV